MKTISHDYLEIKIIFTDSTAINSKEVSRSDPRYTERWIKDPCKDRSK